MNATTHSIPSIPKSARLPINRCNLSAEILGSLSFQSHPRALYIDNVRTLHKELYHHLDAIEEVENRRAKFIDYMNVKFRLHLIEEAGFVTGSRIDRRKADYLNIIRGWFFDSNSIEGAVLKSWAESRFGLITQFHKQHRLHCGNNDYDAFLEDRAKGLYNTNALESQLDLVYSYCQYELSRSNPNREHMLLFRGTNDLDSMQTLQKDKKERVVLLNNVNSFTRSRERACEFGDYVIEANIPLAKIFYYSGLLPVSTAGESEVIVLGGLYKVRQSPL